MDMCDSLSGVNLVIRVLKTEEGRGEVNFMHLDQELSWENSWLHNVLSFITSVTGH